MSRTIRRIDAKAAIQTTEIVVLVHKSAGRREKSNKGIFGPDVVLQTQHSHQCILVEQPEPSFRVRAVGGAAAILMALVQRERTGVGQLIEVGQRNLLMACIGDGLVAHQLGYGTERTGNRSQLIAPQGVSTEAEPSARDVARRVWAAA